MKIKNPATYELQMVIRFLKRKNVCLVLIHMQIVEVYVVKIQRTKCDEMVSFVQRRQRNLQPHITADICPLLNSSAGQFLHILLHTVPFLHPVIITYFSTSRKSGQPV
jgi:hypothetical protein